MENFRGDRRGSKPRHPGPQPVSACWRNSTLSRACTDHTKLRGVVVVFGAGSSSLIPRRVAATWQQARRRPATPVPDILIAHARHEDLSTTHSRRRARVRCGRKTAPNSEPSHLPAKPVALDCYDPTQDGSVWDSNGTAIGEAEGRLDGRDAQFVRRRCGDAGVAHDAGPGTP